MVKWCECQYEMTDSSDRLYFVSPRVFNCRYRRWTLAELGHALWPLTHWNPTWPLTTSDSLWTHPLKRILRLNLWGFFFQNEVFTEVLLFTVFFFRKQISSAWLCFCAFWHCSHRMQSRVYVTLVRQSVSVCPSVPSFGRRTPLLWVRWCGPGIQEISIDCCTAVIV